MSKTTIQWADYSFNPWLGCTKVSPGCAHCYAETLDRNRYSKTMDGGTKAAPVSHWGPGRPRHRTKTWEDPVRWNKHAREGAERYHLQAPRVSMDWPDEVAVSAHHNDPTAAGGFIELKDSHGGDPEEWPTELRVREFPCPSEFPKCSPA